VQARGSNGIRTLSGDTHAATEATRTFAKDCAVGGLDRAGVSAAKFEGTNVVDQKNARRKELSDATDARPLLHTARELRAEDFPKGSGRGKRRRVRQHAHAIEYGSGVNLSHAASLGRHGSSI
jgi:hypothetical protein